MGGARQHGESKGVVAGAADLRGRKGSGESVAQLFEPQLELTRCEAFDEAIKVGRRLVEPDEGEQFGDGLWLGTPRRFPMNGEVHLARQVFRQGRGGKLSLPGVGGIEGDHQFAGVGEMALITFEPLDGGDVGGEQIEHFDIELESAQSDEGWNQENQQQPTQPEPVVHGRR